MRALHAALNWIQSLFRSRQFEREMQAEMQAHVEQQAELNAARGMTERDALAAARRDFGNVGYLQEQSRDARGTRFIEETKRDLLYGMRALLRTPGFTIAILSLALGIGVNTAMLAFMRYIFAPTQLEHPENYTEFPIQITYPTWKLIEAEPNLYATTAAYVRLNVAIEQAGRGPLETEAQLVSDGYFPIYGTRAHLGRMLLRGEDNDALASPAVVLSYAFWQRAYGGDSSVVRRTLRTSNGSVFTIVGVAPGNFVGSELRAPDFWAPLSSRLILPSANGVQGASKWLNNPGRSWLTFAGRLKPGVTLAQARIRTAGVFARSATADTGLARTVGTYLTSGSSTGLTANNATSAALIFSATIMVLLIGCANVANLMLARGVRRRREIAVRMSLGASRVRLIRQLATESLVLAFIGGAVALALSIALLRFVATSDTLHDILQPNSANVMQQLTPNTTIVVLTFIAAFVSAVASGLLPALRSTNMDLSSATRDDGAAMGNRLSRSKLRTGLVIGQVALSLVLLISASVLVRSARNALVMDMGFDRDQLLTATASTYHAAYSDVQRKEFGRLFEERIALSVNPANIARGTVPTHAFDGLLVGTSTTPRKQGRLAFASANYFSVTGIDITKGRAFTAQDVQSGAPVVVISEQTAQTLWPDTDPIGRPITVGRPVYGVTGDSAADVHVVTVVGVARDAQITKVGLIPNTLLYMPADSGDFVMRAPNPDKLIAAITEAARIVDPKVLVRVETMDDIITKQGVVQATGVTATYAGVLGLLALMLSAIGIFGVVAYAVSQRTREIGVRIAIGAQRSDVVAMVLRQGMKPVAYGAAVGLLLSAAAMRVLRVFLFGISPVDPLGYGVAVLFVGTAAVLACYIPARRAAAIDPVGAIRSE
ncbi:MAG: ADOP family duplicated permease [Gemmatimonas sp.]